MIVYLHGFASQGTTEKSISLRERVKDSTVFSPDLPMDPLQVKKIIDELVSNLAPDEPLLFVGTSLGGFYANYFSQKYKVSCVLVNPSIKPFQTLKKALGRNTNYATQAEFMVTTEHLDELETMYKFSSANTDPTLANVFVAKDDQVIPYSESVEAFTNKSASILVFEDGGHRFTDKWNVVLDFIDTLYKK